MDDYEEMLRLAVPAQQVAGPGYIVETASIRSPIPKLWIYALGQAAEAMGLEDPVNQVRFIYTMLGLLGLAAAAAVWWMFHRIGQPDWAVHGLAWTGLHFLAVYVSTRALIENMSMPFFTLAAVLLVVYAREGGRRWLLGSLLTLSIASMFRFQAGIGIIALIAVPLVRRSWRDLAVMLMVGVAAFLATGWIDQLIRGSFHGSLRTYFIYNLYQSSDFGRSRWWAYLGMLVAASLPPLLVGRYRGFPWRQYGALLWPLILIVGAFVALHSVVPHKEDRFMIPVVSAYLALLAPLSAHLVRAGTLGWRGATFLALNIGVVGLIAAVPTQNNTIGVVRWVGDHPGYHALWSVRVSAEPYPIGYTAGPTPPLNETDGLPVHGIDPGLCEDVVAIRSDFLAELREDLTAWEEVAAFKPGLPERVVIMINPKHNTRRNPVHLFVPSGCSEESQHDSNEDVFDAPLEVG
jgi:hypothetical protein